MLHHGTHNSNQGPDFKEARIKINDTLRAGNVELHINSSHWNFAQSLNYNIIILRIVWNHGEEIKDLNGNNLPTFELQRRVSNLLLEKYKQLMETAQFIPCEKLTHNLCDLSLTPYSNKSAFDSRAFIQLKMSIAITNFVYNALLEILFEKKLIPITC